MYFHEWNTTSPEQWTYHTNNYVPTYFIYQISALPVFSDYRFAYLGQQVDQRKVEVAKRQLSMLRQFHNLGSHYTMTLRFIKNKETLSLYLIMTYLSMKELTSQEREIENRRIQNALMNEYHFEEVTYRDDIFDVSWAQEAVEITKQEEEAFGDLWPNGYQQQFYISSMWLSAENTMERLCQALLNHPGRATADITVRPTAYLNEEKDWINENIYRLRESMNGETIRASNTGRILWQGKKLPILKPAVDNYENLNKQYEVSRLFLASIRVFADHGALGLSDSYLVNSVKNKGTTSLFRKGFARFNELAEAYHKCDICIAPTLYWNTHRQEAPLRAQRLSRLVSLEEMTNFFRLPIPMKAGFPGFKIDEGLKQSAGVKKAGTTMRLGSYLDDPSGSKHASLSVEQFAKHGLIVGVPGSGKTTAMFNILYQLYLDAHVPFIVLEPAKTEYRALKTLEGFKEDLLVFTLGDEGISPFRFNPMEVLPGIKLENHISRLQACFVGAFDLFDPLPIFLEQAIRRTYALKGWYDDSTGGEEGVETPTLADLCESAEYIVSHSGFDAKMRSDFQASLLERLNSLRRGSKGRMLDTPRTIPMEELMEKPIIMELDSLNGDEKSLMMMFLLTYVFEYCKTKRVSGSKLKHMLLVEEAHNLISSGGKGGENRADPKAHTIELFINMLAEMRALGEGILIADQLPTAIAPQALKQTNVKILMRVTAKDDREEIGNTMDLNEEQFHQVVHFKTGHAYVFHEGEERVRMLRMVNFKGEHKVEEPPLDPQLKEMMHDYELSHPDIYLPYAGCHGYCANCNRRVRNQAEVFINSVLERDLYKETFAMLPQDALDKMKKQVPLHGLILLEARKEAKRLKTRYKTLGDVFGHCVYVHMSHRIRSLDEKVYQSEEQFNKIGGEYE